VAVGSYHACAGLIREAREAGWNVPIHNLSFVGADQMLDDLRREEASSGKKVINGLIVTQVVPSYEDTSLRLVREYRSAMDKFHPATPPLTSQGGVFDGSYSPPGPYSFGSLEGYLSARAFLTILNKAGKDLTRKKFYDTAEGMGKFDLGLGTPLELSPTHHQALDKVWFTCGSKRGWTSTEKAASCLEGK
jgi:branched-chain amino acid transport system substrate-binding protein